MSWRLLALLAVVAVAFGVAPALAVERDELVDPLTDNPNLPVVRFTRGQRLEDLPGRSLLLPSGPRTVINITLTPATIQAFDGSSGLQFTNGMYRDGETGEVHMFGPTLRLRAGDSYTIYLANNLTEGANKTAGTFNEFRDPEDTNLHTHGLHDSPGVLSQDAASDYYGDDNIFIVVPGKLSPEDEPAHLAMNSSTPPDHMPGLHYYHPHMHGSSMLQSSTANGLIVVEDDETWLPAENGCGEVWGLMQDSPDVLLHLALLTFAPPSAMVLKLGKTQENANNHDTNYQFYSSKALPGNAYCCNGTGAAEGSLPVLGSMANSSFVLVNGGYEPVITMQAGRYQRWRLVNTGYRAMVDLTVLDPATGLPTDKCDLQLLAKDGVYMLQIPRQVGHIFLATGNRAELLVRCEGKPGDKYVIAAGAEPSPFGPGFLETTEAVFIDQPVVATIELAAAEGPTQPLLQQKACTPLRPGYAPDLRNAALEAHNATGALVNESVAFFFSGGCDVNHQAFSFPDPDPLVMPLGKVMQWSFGNPTSHPMHLHVNPFMLNKLPYDRLASGLNFTNWYEVGDYHDTLLAPMLNSTQDPYPVVELRIQPGQFAGYAVMHCHLLHHEDRGCMKVVKWACPDFNETQPEICRDYKYPVPATYTKGAPFPTAPPAAAPAPAAPLPSAAVRRSGGAAQWLLTLAACLLVAARLP